MINNPKIVKSENKLREKHSRRNSKPECKFKPKRQIQAPQDKMDSKNHPATKP